MLSLSLCTHARLRRRAASAGRSRCSSARARQSIIVTVADDALRQSIGHRHFAGVDTAVHEVAANVRHEIGARREVVAAHETVVGRVHGQRGRGDGRQLLRRMRRCGDWLRRRRRMLMGGDDDVGDGGRLMLMLGDGVRIGELLAEMEREGEQVVRGDLRKCEYLLEHDN